MQRGAGEAPRARRSCWSSTALGLARGIAPLVQGYAAFDRETRIAGVILNKVGSERQAAKLRQAIERYTDIPVIGAVGRNEGIVVRERHLGLTTPGETARKRRDRRGRARRGRAKTSICRAFAQSRRARNACRRRSRLSGGAGRPTCGSRSRATKPSGSTTRTISKRSSAQARGSSSSTPCATTVAGLRRPVHWRRLSRDARGRRLSANVALRNSIRSAIASGLPTYAECGGLMYLSRSSLWRGETRWPMVGAIPADARMHERPQGRGLVVLEETRESGLERTRPDAFAAHEFHYAALEDLAPESRFRLSRPARRGDRRAPRRRRDRILAGELQPPAQYARLSVGRALRRLRAERAQARASPDPARTGFAAPAGRPQAHAAARGWRS